MQRIISLERKACADSVSIRVTTNTRAVPENDTNSATVELARTIERSRQPLGQLHMSQLFTLVLAINYRFWLICTNVP